MRPSCDVTVSVLTLTWWHTPTQTHHTSYYCDSCPLQQDNGYSQTLSAEKTTQSRSNWYKLCLCNIEIQEALMYDFTHPSLITVVRLNLRAGSGQGQIVKLSRRWDGNHDPWPWTHLSHQTSYHPHVLLLLSTTIYMLLNEVVCPENNRHRLF